MEGGLEKNGPTRRGFLKILGAVAAAAATDAILPKNAEAQNIQRSTGTGLNIRGNNNRVEGVPPGARGDIVGDGNIVNGERVYQTPGSKIEMGSGGNTSAPGDLPDQWPFTDKDNPFKE